MANDLKMQAHEIVSRASDMSSTLSNCNGWRDHVKDSYHHFTESVIAQLRSLEYDCAVVQDKAANAASVNAEKYQSELEGYRARLRGL